MCVLCAICCVGRTWHEDEDVWGEANVKLILPNCQLSDLYFEMDSPKCPLWP